MQGNVHVKGGAPNLIVPVVMVYQLSTHIFAKHAHYKVVWVHVKQGASHVHRN
jgi:hypothetical protein